MAQPTSRDRFAGKQHNQENRRLRRTGGVNFPRRRRSEKDANIIEGRNPIVEALRAGRAMKRLLVSTTSSASATVEEIIFLAEEAKIPVERVDRSEIARLSVTGKSQGVLAVAGAKGYANLEQLLKIARQRKESALLVVLDGIQDPHNLGAIIRTAEAAGVHGVVVPERRSVGLTPGVARSSAGAVEHMAVARVANLANAMVKLAKSDVLSVGIDPRGPVTYTEVDYSQPIALVVGAEGKGISRLVKERCDTLAGIPMAGRLGSLNASVSAALVMYEAMRQRRG